MVEFKVSLRREVGQRTFNQKGIFFLNDKLEIVHKD